jgi:hypothetical protein
MLSTQRFPRGALAGNYLETEPTDPLNQSMYEMPSQGFPATQEDAFGKHDELRKQGEYLQFLKNKQQIIEMEN